MDVHKAKQHTVQLSYFTGPWQFPLQNTETILGASYLKTWHLSILLLLLLIITINFCQELETTLSSPPLLVTNSGKKDSITKFGGLGCQLSLENTSVTMCEDLGSNPSIHICSGEASPVVQQCCKNLSSLGQGVTHLVMRTHCSA